MIKPKITILESESAPCTIIIQDSTGFGDSGFPENSSTRNYSLSDTVIINIIARYSKNQSVDIEKNKIVRFFNSNSGTYEDIVTDKTDNLKEDGWYNIHTFYVPNKKLFDIHPEYFTEVNRFIYNEETKRVEDLDGNEINLLEHVDVIDYTNYSINRTTVPFFNTCYSQNCYIKINLAIANQGCDYCTESRELRKRRDQIWSILYGAIFRWNNGDYEIADYMLNFITECNGLCDKLNLESDCNCN